MSVKRILGIVALSLLIISSFPAKASNPIAVSSSATSPVNGEDPRLQPLMERLREIKDLDKSGLSGSEKKDLRKEVRGIRKEMKKISGGVYLSVGAIIIIILLLILIV